MSEDATERLRLFVALDLPSPIREALLTWRSAQLGSVPELRPVAPDALHATLCFLGNLPSTATPGIAAACEGAVRRRPVGELRLGTVVWLPPRRPRVLAVELGDPAGDLGRLQGEVAQALCEAGLYTPEKRPFLAHVTVARVAARARVRATELPAPAALTFRAPTITLYRSRLQRAGARYEPLARVALSYPGRQA